MVLQDRTNGKSENTGYFPCLLLTCAYESLKFCIITSRYFAGTQATSSLFVVSKNTFVSSSRFVVFITRPSDSWCLNIVVWWYSRILGVLVRMLSMGFVMRLDKICVELR